MAKSVRSSDYDEYRPSAARSIHDKVSSRVIAGGGVEAGWFALASIASAAFVATRKNDLTWGAALAIGTFFVAGGAREDATIRDFSLGVLGGSAGVTTVRLMGRLNKASGQQ